MSNLLYPCRVIRQTYSGSGLDLNPISWQDKVIYPMIWSKDQYKYRQIKPNLYSITVTNKVTPSAKNTREEIKNPCKWIATILTNIKCIMGHI